MSNPRTYQYERVTDESTGYNDVIRVTDGDTLIEDVNPYEAGRHIVELLDVSERHLRDAAKAYSAAQEAHRSALYITVQAAWKNRQPTGLDRIYRKADTTDGSEG